MAAFVLLPAQPNLQKWMRRFDRPVGWVEGDPSHIVLNNEASPKPNKCEKLGFAS
jgi:hypothetical protein